jgi:asparagine synthase (glutamine-hydrolysing)
MCGIAGFTHFGEPSPTGVLRRAINGLKHRGPNQQGTFEAANISMGAVRLKIIDLAGGDQPIQTTDGEYVIVFNGEIYNHAELRRELESLGHHFESHCDTEVALRAFVEWDLDCFCRFRGMFAIAYWQRSRQRLLLARDRLGIKPLYYTMHRGNLHFGSELKAILEHPEIPRHVCGPGLDYYLSLNYVPTPYTLVDGIEKILPGTWLEFEQGRIRNEHYWRNTFEPRPLSMEDACLQLDDLLRQSISEHLISDVPLGIWASGGLDSSTILHYASQVSSRRLETYSISFAGRRFDESEYFRLLAGRYNTSHHEFDLSTDHDLPEAIYEMAWYSDEPSADAGALPVWFLSKMTARHVTVALSGEGADEIFGGYQTYLADRYASWARRIPKPMLRLALRAADAVPVSDEKIGFDYKLKRFLSGALLPADEAHFFWNGTFSTEEKRQLGLQAPVRSAAALCKRLEGLPPASNVVNRYLFVDQHYYLSDDILYKCDRMSMAHSLEVRPPFLDHRIAEFAASLPESLKIRGRSTKHLLRTLVERKLPRQILQRRKEGLDIPAQEWLRGPLRPLIEEALCPESVRGAGLFAPAAIESVKQRHFSRKENLGYHLWGLLTLHLWMRRWNVQAHSDERDYVLASAHVQSGRS